MNNRNKKSQITLFVILGLVLLIIFILIFTIKREAEPKPMSIKTILNELEIGSVKNHVTNCIIQTGMDGLEKIGANGGVIYDFEGGTIPFNNMRLGEDYLNFTSLQKSYFVIYGLKENTLCNAIDYRAPDYPCPNALFSEFNTIYNHECLYDSFYSAYDGFFGMNTMSKLCYITRESGCEGFAKGMELGLTMQRQLEDYVAKNLPLCVDFSAFTTRLGVDITAEAEPSVEVDVYNSEILFLVKYPLKISFENQEPVSRIINYQTTIETRLGLIYNFLYNVLSLDSKNIEFSTPNEFISSYYWRPGLELKKIDNVCTSCPLPYIHDDIIEIIDRDSKVNGKPFLFRTAVRNRRPVLEPVQDLKIDLNNTNVINLALNAQDPDDAGLTYYFLSLGFGRAVCGGKGTFTPHTSFQDTGWCEHYSGISGANSKLKQQGVLDMRVNKYDSGEHQVGILILDDSGLFDYQLFLINITDSRFTNTPRDQCIADCYDSGGIYDCDSWCKIAINPCSSGTECSGGDFNGDPNSNCWKCVYPAFYSKTPQMHLDCSQLDKEVCNNNMPDCFWVIENQSNAFVESCYNDHDLYMVQNPAYIIVN